MSTAVARLPSATLVPLSAPPPPPQGKRNAMSQLRSGTTFEDSLGGVIKASVER